MFGEDELRLAKQTEVMTHVIHANGWDPDDSMSYTSQNLSVSLIKSIRSKLPFSFERVIRDQLRWFLVTGDAGPFNTRPPVLLRSKVNTKYGMMEANPQFKTFEQTMQELMDGTKTKQNNDASLKHQNGSLQTTERLFHQKNASTQLQRSHKTVSL